MCRTRSECEAAARLEQAGASCSGRSSDGGGGGTHKPSLHLVVLGHVDAGKSTLMGRLLFELGHVSAKDVHRNQRDAAAAGKVRRARRQRLQWRWG